MLQIPLEIPPSSEVLPATGFERFTAFLILYFLLLSLIALSLPRPWFVSLFKIALPFMPDRLPRDDDAKD